MKKIVYILAVALYLLSCSSGKNALEKGNYIDAISKAVNRLSNDPDNRKARQVISTGYPMAIEFYQEEIDNTLSSNDRMRWNRTLQIMEQVNYLSDQIRRVPAARQLVPNPKTYTSEITDVKNRAAEERYQEGLQLMQRQTRDDTKEAYFNFKEADRLVPAYKDVLDRMQQAKELATLKVIVEPLPAPSMRYELTADFFYTKVMEQLNNRFPAESFVNFYSPDEAENAGMQYPDMVVHLAFFDFYVGKPNHYEETQTLKREVDVKTPVKVSKDSVRYEVRKVMKTGKIKIITDEVASGGVLDLQIEEFQTRKLLVSEKIPGEYMWRNRYGIYVGDEDILTKEEIAIISNNAIMPPGPQDMFIAFTQPIFSRLNDNLNSFFRRYN